MSDARDTGYDLSEVLGDAPHLPAHVYIHVPFCRLKCSYCDFFSVDDLNPDTIAVVVRSIEGQIKQWANAGLPGVIETVYLGGGTPTVIVGRAVQIVRAVFDALPMRAGAEITVEANPDSVTPNLMELFGAAGVTRVSLGVQSFVPKELSLLGRVHTVEESHNAMKAIRDARLDLALDLMCGIPGQSRASWVESLERALRSGASHISVYPLTLEEGTPLAVAVDSGLVEEPDPDLAAEQMMIAEELLGAAGLPRYEVSNYARPGHESRHNTAYWTGRSYLAIGPAAHGMLDPATARAVGMIEGGEIEQIGRVRYAAPRDIADWLTLDPDELDILTPEETAREDVMLGLRLVRGVTHGAVVEAGVDEALYELEREGLVERVTASGKPVIDDGVVPSMRWKTTRRGWLLGNEVYSRVWAGYAGDVSGSSWHSL